MPNLTPDVSDVETISYQTWNAACNNHYHEVYSLWVKQYELMSYCVLCLSVLQYIAIL